MSVRPCSARVTRILFDRAGLLQLSRFRSLPDSVLKAFYVLTFSVIPASHNMSVTESAFATMHTAATEDLLLAAELDQAMAAVAAELTTTFHGGTTKGLDWRKRQLRQVRAVVAATLTLTLTLTPTLTLTLTLSLTLTLTLTTDLTPTPNPLLPAGRCPCRGEHRADQGGPAQPPA
eukprot:scaffold97012_cov51-Phaeocystis_antarctica.AAC.2